ncbi:MAG: ABC transporter substrate-binding protein [Candidatus Vecturithrix sp.]|jgi:polar amino acid transport system substrate-binding protein|nr:ABC transporter substrate-binding protein [Candidatus Vecturithrix sp.]
MKHRYVGLLVFILSLMLVCSLALTVAADTLEEIVKRGELRVAVQTQGPPFSFMDKNGERTGSSVEFCRLMAQEMGVEIKFLDFDWDGLIPALLSGKADMLAGDMTATLARALKVSFTDPFYNTPMVVFAKKGSTFKTLEDCNRPEVKVALLLGSTGEVDAKRFLSNAELKSYKGGGPMLINAILAGHADIGVNDESALIAQLANFPPDSIEILPVTLSTQPLAFAVRPEDTHLLQWINLFFKWIREDGRYDDNINYWVKSMDWTKDH